MLKAARFLLAYARHPVSSVQEREITLEVDGAEVPGSLYSLGGGRPRPGWVVLHGITVPGRRHPVLQRFARSLAASGGVVLIPEIVTWQRLRIDPAIADHTIAGASRHLATLPGVSPGGVGVVGFSFGATQALITAARPEMRDVIRSVVAFGGYCDLARTLRFMMLGEHEWKGRHYREDPDPYGRWIVAANYLTRAPGLEGLEGVRDAAAELAAEAGRRFVFAGDPQYDPLKAELRARLTPAERDIWDLLAPPTGTAPPEAPTRELADRLVEAALATHPELDPRPVLPRLDRRIVLAHGHADQLIPFTETLRLESHIGPDADLSTTITRLFAHSREADRLGVLEYPAEMYRYMRLLARAIG